MTRCLRRCAIPANAALFTMQIGQLLAGVVILSLVGFAVRRF
jgi:hypothetical protein